MGWVKEGRGGRTSDRGRSKVLGGLDAPDVSGREGVCFVTSRCRKHFVISKRHMQLCVVLSPT